MESSKSFVAVDSYRKAATKDAAVWNYKGLTIHALPQVHEHIAGILKANLPLGASVLDLASGSGAMCLRLKDMGMRPTGTDLVCENFRLHSQVDFFTANLNEELPTHLHQKFDCVVATELIEHLENPRHLLRQCFSLLRPSGMLVLSTPNTESSISMAQFIRSGDFRWFAPAQYNNDGHITPILLPVLRHALEECGFVDIRIDSAAPLSFSGLAWWRMRLLAWVLRRITARPLLEGDFLIACASRLR
jgi:cyclopropane fatty-acyl-phospholipid synthase-like methyltransferase